MDEEEGKKKKKSFFRQGIEIAGNMALNIIKKLIIGKLKLIAIIILAIILVIFLFGSLFHYVIDTGTITSSKETAQDISNSAIIDLEEGYILLNDDVVDKLIERLEEDQNTSPARLKLAGDIDYSADDKTNQDLMRKYIRAFIAAEVTTQYPNMTNKPGGGIIRDFLDNIAKEMGKYQGAVKFCKSDNNGNKTEEYLTYMRKEEFEALCAEKPEYMTLDEYIDKVSSHFSLEGDNIILASWTKDKDGVTITTTQLNYKQYVSQYSMPFEFLISLCAITQNPEFVLNVAKMTIDSEIILAVQYNITKTTHTKTVTRLDTDTVVDSESTHTERYTPQINMVYAKTWIVEQSVEYTKKEETEERESTRNEVRDFPIIITDENGNEQQIGTTQAEVEIYSRTETTTITYEEGPTQSKSREEEFLGLISNPLGEIPFTVEGVYNPNAKWNPEGGNKVVKYKIPNSKTMDAPHQTIVTSAQVLFNYLQQSDRTQNHEQIMRYLLYVYSYKEKNYGVTTLDFSIFEPNEYVTIRGASSFTTYLMEWESTRTDANGDYIIHDDGEGNLTVGYGIYIKAQLGRFPVDIQEKFKNGQLNVGDVISKEIIEPINEQVMQDFYNGVVKTTAGLNLKQHQLDALAAVSYQHGNIGNFVNMYKQYGNTEELRNVVKTYRTEVKYFAGTTSEAKRQNANWKLFHEGIYTDRGGNEMEILVSGSVTQTGSQKDGYSGIYTSSSGKSYKEYKQGWGVWANKPYANKNMSSMGCSVTADAIILSAYNSTITPESIRPKNGALISVDGKLMEFGISVFRDRNGVDRDELISHLNSGKPAIIYIKGSNNSYTNSEHWMALLDINSNNQVYVSNPNGSGPNGWDSIDNLLRNASQIIYVNS